MSEIRKNRVDTIASEAGMTQTESSMDTTEIDLLELLYRLLANWKKIIGLALVLAILVGVYTVFCVAPMYEATSTIYVLNRGDSAITLSDLNLGSALTQDYIKVFQMWEVHESVISNLDLPYTYTEMKKKLSVTNASNTRMLDITVSSPDPEEAAAIANEYAKVASDYIADSMSTNKPNIMSVALVPSNPVSPNKTRNVLLGFILGLVIGCGCVAVELVLDDKYKTSEDIRKYTGLVTLAIVPIEQMDHTNNKKNSRRHS